MLILLASLALADVVPEPPERCPQGSVGVTGHTGAYCQARTCETDTCESGETCRAAGLCVEVRVVPCGGWQTGDEGCTETQEIAHGTCSSQADCVAGTCQMADRCASATTGCSSAPGGAAGLGALLLTALALRERRRCS